MVNQEENAKLKRIRFEQRLANFEKAYAAFENILAEDTEHNVIARTALIQAFEFTFELAWKAMRDRLEAAGDARFETVNPRETIAAAFDNGYFKKTEPWAEALKMRNTSSHAYDETFAVSLEKFIRLAYAPILKDLLNLFKSNNLYE